MMGFIKNNLRSLFLKSSIFSLMFFILSIVLANFFHQNNTKELFIRTVLKTLIVFIGIFVGSLAWEKIKKNNENENKRLLLAVLLLVVSWATAKTNHTLSNICFGAVFFAAVFYLYKFVMSLFRKEK